MQIISSFCQENELEGNWRTAEGNILTGGRTIGEKIVNQLSRVSHAAKLSRTGAISFFLQSNVCKTIRDVLASKWSKNAQYISWSHFNFYQGLLLFVVFYSLLVVVIYILLFTILSHCGKHASCNARHATQHAAAPSCGYPSHKRIFSPFRAHCLPGSVSALNFNNRSRTFIIMEIILN